ncbi:general odorant-binding protein 45-like [Toxorhynchites rutilus septentrionalis]|uniref:general odorant-binding protein 45-like n=1 Tax=Toxorhynchites rutilus septentrionalis TaxID=329112 RepID=UPI00247A8B06|nr:general odorant-binding protein 45-like [Toxorhynchites rutilus septentrionalis]
MTVSCWYRLCVVLMLTLAPLSLCTADTPNEALLQAQTTCVRYLGISESRLVQYNASFYPPDRDTMCMIRCVGIMLGFWDDEKGLLLNSARQFFPTGNDVGLFSQKVLQCIERKLTSYNPSDACARAYHSFRCAMRSIDQPNTIEKLTPEKFVRALVTCAKILRIPPNHLKLYKQGIFPDDTETRCLLRCFGIRTDLYSDTDGPNLERLHAQFAEDQPLEDFKTRAKMCIEANRPMIKDNCTAAYRNLYLCFKQYFNAFITRNRAALLNLSPAPAAPGEMRPDMLVYRDDI